MGHCQFGARVCYSDCIFLTFSPNEQHSALTLRLMRYRQGDPCVQGDEPVQQEIRRSSGRDAPVLESPACAHRKSEESYATELPSYEFRRVCTARDPLAVMEAYSVQIRLRLARLLVIRMCPRCPMCNADSLSGGNFPCQDKFGSNMLPMGGAMGASVAFGAATEHQGQGTLHLHGELHVI